MATPNYEIDGKKTFADVEAAETAARNEISTNIDTAISNYEQEINKQIDNAEQWKETQSQIQQERTDFTIDQINQQKEQAQQDYTKEQSGAYADWQKQSNQYGVNAEQMAAQGMANTGYSESSQVSMFNAYQNRVAVARESFNRAVISYDNAIRDAQLQNNAALAEIAYQALQTQAELSIQFVQRRDELLMEKTNKLLEVDQIYHAQYQDVLDQINRENALAEEARQFNESKTLEKDIADAKLEEEKRQFDALHGTENIIELEEQEPEEPVIDMDSLNALGIGTPTEEYLNRYIADGWVEMYQEGNSVKFKLTPSGTEHFKRNLLPDQESLKGVLVGMITKDNIEGAIKSGLVETYIDNGSVKYRFTEAGHNYAKEWYARQGKHYVKDTHKKNAITMLENIGDNW